MAITIDDTAGRIASDDCDTEATRDADGSWTVTGRTGRYDRNQALSAVTVAELYAAGDERDSPLVRDLENELAVPAHGYRSEEDDRG